VENSESETANHDGAAEHGDGVGVPPIAIEGSGVSTSVSVVIAQSSGGCVRRIGRLGSAGSVWEMRWVQTLVNRLGGWGVGVKYTWDDGLGAAST
jgi:hypothetical protein